MDRWVWMWSISACIFFSLKLLSLSAVFWRGPASDRPKTPRIIGYLFSWPGMNAETFLSATAKLKNQRVNLADWALAVLNVAVGVIFFAILPRLIHRRSPDSVFVVGWSGMIGVALVLHFGVFSLLSLLWRSYGIDAPALMRTPVFARSLSDFWGNRWNTAFRDVAHRCVFRPATKVAGAPAATLAVFLFSGVVHDLAISIPAGGGYGLPTVYFLIQGTAVLMERKFLSKHKSNGIELLRRTLAWVCVVGGAGLLFHSPFIANVMIPMLTDCGVIGTD